MASALPTSSGNVLDMAVADHRRIQYLWEEYHGPKLVAENKQKLAWAIIRAVSMHASKEEEVLYPAVCEKMGSAAYQQLLQEHQVLKNTLSQLNNMDINKVGEAAFNAQLKLAIEELLDHIREEEQVFFPRFAQMDGVDSEYLHKLGKAWKAADAHSVTRPHPWAPNKPPLNWVANMATAPLDFLMDQYRFGLKIPDIVA